ncbi:regulatory LuxR family protein [Williamsia limnetica]|uniref:Regulatory LuxR family protein n=1 Tax=Williamsia limnetica TaxID=882452 RepID=A0A318RF24_WILLI|nr:LuxR C-terminal-related transcriptional regulator [Williamsia limnetica]PYE11695.1 regulatory LuxR family protein [Williamsia limnetica]
MKKRRAAATIFRRLVEIDVRLREQHDLDAHVNPASLREALDLTTATIESVLTPSGPPPSIETVDLIAELLDVQLSGQQLLTDRVTSSSKKVASSVRRLSSIATSSNLAQQICMELVETADFTRATYSTLTPEGWEPQIAYPRQATSDPISDVAPVATSAEERCVRTRSVIIFDQVEAIRSSETYVVSPIVINDRVIGLLHAYQQFPLVADSDGAALLALYTSTFVTVNEREAWTHRVWMQRQIVSDLASELIHRSEVHLSGDLALDAPDFAHIRPVERTDVADMSSSLDALLTARETEVMHLIVAGSSNADIAEKLFITVETVKSHVKKILRKLGAVNRSEAISLYLDRA